MSGSVVFGFKGSPSKAQAQPSVDELRFAALLRSQAFIEFELDGTVVDANDNFCQFTGYRLDEVVGRHHSMFMDPADSAAPEYHEFWRRLRAGEFVSTKFRRVVKGGREVWIQASYNPVLDAAGRPVRVMKIATDITEAEQTAARNQAAREENERQQAFVVEALGGALRSLAEGDLSAQIDARFEGGYVSIKDDFNSAVSSLRTAFSQVSQAMNPMRAGAQEIAKAASDLSRRTEQQAASLEETAAALDEITATVSNSSQGAQRAANVAGGARMDARRSGEVVGQAVEAMNAIEQSSRQITDIIGVIDEIAFQTNLLALNAGVEAARAGEAGKGFAVVASEVRALAQRSAEAAKEIKALISASREQVEKGVALVAETGGSLGGLVGQADEIDALIADIARSAQEQSTSLGQVNTAVNEMDKVTQQNAAMVEQTSAAAQQLQERSADLQAALSRFRLGSAEARTHAPSYAAPAPRLRAAG